MSGLNTGRAPHSDPEWARSVEQRIRALEQASTLKAGEWRILQRGDRLLAMKPGVTVALDGAVVVEEAGGGAGRGFVEKFRSELINDLTGAETTLTGQGGLAAIIADLRALLGHPAGLGTGFPAADRAGGNIVDFIGDLIDKIFSGAQGDTTTARRTAADVANALAGHRLSILSNTQIAEAVALAVADAAYSRPAYHAVDPTLDGVFNLTTITGTAATTISVKQNASVIGYIRIPTATRKATVVWQGYGTVNIDRIMVNVFKVNTATDANTPIFSRDAMPFVSNTLLGGQIPWVYVPIGAMDVEQGDCYGAEVAVEGSGTHTMVGLPDHWLAANPNVYPSQLAATRAAAPPLFEALGSRLTINTDTTNPAGTLQHRAAEDSTVIVAVYTRITSGLAAAFDREVTYAGIGMQSLGVINHNNASNGWTEFFVLERAPNLGGGTATVAVSITGAGTFRAVTAQAVSYRNVGSVGALETNYGNAVSLMSGVLACDAATRIVHAFSGTSGGAPTYAITGYSSLIRDSGTVLNGAQSLPFVLGEGSAAPSLQFTATGSKGTTPWSSAGVALQGIVPPAQYVAYPVYSRHVPWIALSSQTDASRGTYAPERTPFPTHNIYDYTTPVWCTDLDWAGVGAGGSGQGEIGLNMGQGGEAGEWGGVTLVAGVDFIPGETTFTVTPGAGGAAIIGYFGNGHDGEATLIEWIDPGGAARTISMAGGDGGRLVSLFRYSGASPGDFVYGGLTFYGGKGCAPGLGGNSPGGGGGGAVIFQPFSGKGADGAAWAIARQVGIWTPPPTPQTETIEGTLMVHAAASGAHKKGTQLTGSLAVTAARTGTANVSRPPAGPQNIAGSLAVTAARTGTGRRNQAVSGSLAVTAACSGSATLTQNNIYVADYATPQLAANAASGKHLVFPAGVTYTVTGLTIPANCYIDGNNSVLKFGNNTTTVSSDDALLTVNGSGVTIDNLNFDGNSANQAGLWTEHRHCVKMLGTFSNVTVKNCDMINIISDGVYVNTQTGSNIKIGPNNTFATSAVHARNAVSVVTGDTVEVFSNTFNYVSRNDMPGPVDIEPNAPTDHLAHVDVHDNTIIGGSVSETGTLPGIVYGGFVNCPATDIKIRNNNISGTRFTAGVLVIGMNGGPFNTATGIVISGNVIHDLYADGNGVELDYWIGADVINNTISGAWYGINNYLACLGASTGNTFGAGVGPQITNTTPHCS